MVYPHPRDIQKDSKLTWVYITQGILCKMLSGVIRRSVPRASAVNVDWYACLFLCVCVCSRCLRGSWRVVLLSSVLGLLFSHPNQRLRRKYSLMPFLQHLQWCSVTLSIDRTWIRRGLLPWTMVHFVRSPTSAFHSSEWYVSLLTILVITNIMFTPT